MPNIISGEVQAVKSEAIVAIAVSPSGKELLTQTQILPSNTPSVKSNTMYLLVVNSSGNAIV
jgi:hypothetical protein